MGSVLLDWESIRLICRRLNTFSLQHDIDQSGSITSEKEMGTSGCTVMVPAARLDTHRLLMDNTCTCSKLKLVARDNMYSIMDDVALQTKNRLMQLLRFKNVRICPCV